MKELAQVSLARLAVDLAVFPNRKRLAHDDHQHDQGTEEKPGVHSSLRTTTTLSRARVRGRDMTHTGLIGGGSAGVSPAAKYRRLSQSADGAEVESAMRAVEDTDLHEATTSRASATAVGDGLSLDEDQEPEPNQQPGDEADIEGRAPPNRHGAHECREQERQHKAGEPTQQVAPAHPIFDPMGSESPGGGRRTATRSAADRRCPLARAEGNWSDARATPTTWRLRGRCWLRSTSRPRSWRRNHWPCLRCRYRIPRRPSSCPSPQRPSACRFPSCRRACRCLRRP
jgi:hypothetical protein